LGTFYGCTLCFFLLQTVVELHLTNYVFSCLLYEWKRLPHVVTEDDVYKGFSVPKGTFVVTNLAALNFDPEVYADPHTFNPERFLGVDASSAALSASREVVAALQIFFFFFAM
jgi:hypothetical protein